MYVLLYAVQLTTHFINHIHSNMKLLKLNWPQTIENN